LPLVLPFYFQAIVLNGMIADKVQRYYAHERFENEDRLSACFFRKFTEVYDGIGKKR